MNLLSLQNISVSFGTQKVLKDLSMDIKKGSFVSILGVNGSGKSTLLNIIAGLSKPNSGKIVWESETTKDKISYVFQNYRDTLFPWKSAWENIALPLKLKGVEKAERKSKVDELVKKFNVEIDLEKYPYQLSGGQQQMIAILRSVITEPELILFDEPFTAMDFQKRLFLQNKVLEIWEQTNATILFVSHDIDEAIYMADEVILLKNFKTINFNELKINRPRNISTLSENNFVQIKDDIYNNVLNNN